MTEETKVLKSGAETFIDRVVDIGHSDFRCYVLVDDIQAVHVEKASGKEPVPYVRVSLISTGAWFFACGSFKEANEHADRIAKVWREALVNIARLSSSSARASAVS